MYIRCSFGYVSAWPADMQKEQLSALLLRSLPCIGLPACVSLDVQRYQHTQYVPKLLPALVGGHLQYSCPSMIGNC